MCLKFHLLPRCWSSTVRIPFFKPISLRFWPSSPVRLRLSSQSRPASNPVGASGAGAIVPDSVAGDDGGAATGGIVDGDRSGGGAPAASLLEVTPVASGRVLSPVETVTLPSGVIRTASSASTRLR